MQKILIEFILFNSILFSFFLYFTFYYHNKHLKKQKKPKVTFIQFLNNSKEIPSFEKIMLGLTFGIIFGFMDNFGLWMGINKLEKILPGGLLTKSGLGNTYSDTLGAIIGTCISIIAQDSFNYNDNDMPIWLNTVGIITGCFLGMFVGHIVTGKK